MSIQPTSLLFQQQKKYQLPEGTAALPATVTTLVFIPAGQKDEVKEMLQKLMIACQLNETNSLLLEESFPLQRVPGLQRVLLFGGVETYFPNFELKLHKPAQIGGVQWFFSYSLQELFENRDRKKDITWKALKDFFHIDNPKA